MRRFSTKVRKAHPRLRQMKKLIPNTYLMKIYDMKGNYIRTVLVQLDVDDDTT